MLYARSKSAKMEGYIRLYFGPMFASKTTRMLSDVETIVRSTGKSACLVKFSKDDRYDSFAAHGGLITHSGYEQYKLPIIPCTSLADIEGDLLAYSVIGVSETQFIKDLHILNKLADGGRYIICEGLVSDANRKPFADLVNFMSTCDEAICLHGICSCGKQSTFTSKKDEAKNGEQVDIGGADKYTTFCRTCYVKNQHRQQNH